jgi:hypothetical protein
VIGRYWTGISADFIVVFRKRDSGIAGEESSNEFNANQWGATDIAQPREPA